LRKRQLESTVTEEVFVVFSKEISLQTRGFSDIVNITDKVRDVLEKSEVKEGIVHIFNIGSTGSISTIEYEPALVEDMKEKLEDLVPRSMSSRHSQTWGDDNGFSHIRATLMGPNIAVPVSGGTLVLGTWQQIIAIDHDNRSRSRRIFIQVMGE
jgi:secondary thiamine-phosphate synthase enzyme